MDEQLIVKTDFTTARGIQQLLLERALMTSACPLLDNVSMVGAGDVYLSAGSFGGGTEPGQTGYIY